MNAYETIKAFWRVMEDEGISLEDWVRDWRKPFLEGIKELEEIERELKQLRDSKPRPTMDFFDFKRGVIG